MIDLDPSWECIAVYGPVQYSTVQYSTVQYITTVISGSRHYRPAPSSGVGVGVGVGVGNILWNTVRYEDINIDIISYTIVFSCNPQEKYLHKNTVIYLCI